MPKFRHVIEKTEVREESQDWSHRDQEGKVLPGEGMVDFHLKWQSKDTSAHFSPQQSPPDIKKNENRDTNSTFTETTKI